MNSIVLLSGGIDSMACVKFYLTQGYDVEGLFFDYGQPALIAERIAAGKIAEYYGIPFRIAQIPHLHSDPLGEIYGRNAVLSICALGLYGYGTYKIAMGLHAGTNYSDCTIGFVDRINCIYDLYANGTVILEAPFIEWSKGQVISYCNDWSLPLDLTFSCEYSGEKPCGKCKSCLDRKVWLNE